VNRVIFLIDGFNLYHSLKDEYPKYKWLNLEKLCRAFILPRDDLRDIYYFTALAFWDKNKQTRHKILIKALQSKGVKIVYGEFKIRDKICRICHKSYTTAEEKRTDVNIAVHLLKLAILDAYDTAIIITGDTDLIPAIEATFSIFPSKRIGIIFPPGRAVESLKNLPTFWTKIRSSHLRDCLFPPQVQVGPSDYIDCPKEWL